VEATNTGPIVAIVQARMESTRLPGKVLFPLGKSSVLEHVVRRARGFAEQVVVCTSDRKSDDAIEAHCAEIGCACVRGDSENVFQRFRDTLASPNVMRTHWFARVTADCPLLSTTLARHLVAHTRPEFDLVAVPDDQITRGLAVELVRRFPFEEILDENLDAPQREHVTLCFYERTETYRCHFIDAPDALRQPSIRLTLDYPEDYELLFRLFERDEELTAEQAVDILLQDPELAATNQNTTQKAPR